MVTVNCKEDSICEYLRQYATWIDWYNLYVSERDPIVDIGLGIPCYHQTDIKSINKCEESVVFIDCATEGLHLYDLFNQYRKDCHYVIFSNGWWDQEKVKIAHEKINIDYDLIWYPFFLHDMNNTYHNTYRFSFYLDKTYLMDYPKPLMFVSTIGTASLQRDDLVNIIKTDTNYDNFILKYSGVDYGIDSSKYDIVNVPLGEFNPNIYLLEKYGHTVRDTIPIQMYNQAYFNLVVETDLDMQDCFFLTEKTVKAIFTGIPFVIMSTPYFLKHLRELGFCTYNDLWDESYDNETDYNKRVNKIVDLCNELQHFDWEANKDRLSLVYLKNCYNAQHLNNIASKGFEDFEKVIKELKNKY